MSFSVKVLIWANSVASPAMRSRASRRLLSTSDLWDSHHLIDENRHGNTAKKNEGLNPTDGGSSRSAFGLMFNSEPNRCKTQGC